jgi:hypothetical protein
MVMKQVMLVLGMIVVFVMTGRELPGRVVYVPGDFSGIQDAIAGSAHGDTIIVKPGVYRENIDFLGKRVHVVSEMGPGVTIIDGQQAGSVVTFSSLETKDTVLDGFGIQNGSGTYLAPGFYGGGIFCDGASPTIVGNVIEGNVVDEGGGGIYLNCSSAYLSGNVIRANSAFWGGGLSAVYGSAEVDENAVRNNVAYYGAGICCTYDLTCISGTPIQNNTAYYSGGGVAFMGFSDARLSQCEVSGNIAYGGGGGVCCETESSPILSELHIFQNFATGYGGGIALAKAWPTIVNCTVVSNESLFTGGGIGCGMNYTPAKAVNTIFWDNTAPTGTEIYVAVSGVFSMEYSDVSPGVNAVYVYPGGVLNFGPGMLSVDPIFVDKAGRDYHLSCGSPCRDAGYGHSAISTTDFEGDPRTVCGKPDIGADEYYYHLYHSGDVIPGNNIDLKVVGIPGMPVKFAVGAGIQDPPQATYYGNLHLTLPLTGVFNLGLIPSDGVLKYGSTVPMSWSSGEEKYFQALVGGLGNPNSVLTNLMTLEVE